MVYGYLCVGGVGCVGVCVSRWVIGYLCLCVWVFITINPYFLTFIVV